MTRLESLFVWGTGPIYLAILHDLFYNPDYSWVPRSGAITVIVAIWYTFKQFKNWDYTDIFGPYMDYRNIWKDPQIPEKNKQAENIKANPKNFKIVIEIEKSLLMLGTFVWGFGDLLSEIHRQEVIYWLVLIIGIIQFFIFLVLDRAIKRNDEA